MSPRAASTSKHRARRELRSAAAARRFHPPRRPHGPRRSRRRSFHIRDCGSAATSRISSALLKLRLTLKETPDGLGREERHAAVIEMPARGRFSNCPPRLLRAKRNHSGPDAAARAASSEYPAASRISTSRPEGARLRQCTVPLHASTQFLTIASPRPTPPDERLREVSTR